MWQYEYNNELYHYGVKGMKWGVRRTRNEALSSARSNYKAAKKNYKRSNIEYSKSFDRAYNYSGRHLISQYVNKKHKAESDRRWADAVNKAEASKQAKKDYKQAKKEYKQVKAERKKAINETYKDINSKTSFGEKLVFNEGIRKKAAQYVVDNNMSINDAKKKANRQAIRNTALLLGAYGAIKASRITTQDLKDYVDVIKRAH